MIPFDKIALIGSGNVAYAYVKALKNNGIQPFCIFTRSSDKIAEIEKSFGVKATSSFDDLLDCDLIVIAVKDDAKDLTQETFLKALIYKEKYVNHNNFKAWVYTIMKNIFINNYRRTKKANTIIDQSEDLYYLNISNINTDTDPQSIINSMELERGIKMLDEEFRRAFDMYNDGYKYKEIADCLHLTIGTVKSRIFYSRKKLMNQLSEFCPN